MIQWKQQQTPAKLIDITLTDWEGITFDFFKFYNDNYTYFDDYLLFSFGNRKIWLLDDETNEATVYNTWLRYSSSIIHSKAYEYQRMWDSLKAEYNPIENYDKYSEIETTGDTHTDTTKTPDIVTKNSGGTTVSSSGTSPYDTTDFSNVDKNTTIIPETSTTVENHDIEMEYGNTKSNVTEHTHGNVGVTTNQQMITSELELRKNNFIIMILTDVINHTTIY